MANKKNSLNFVISILDLVVELFYKITTNFRSLGSSGRYFSDMRVELVWTLLAHSIQKINSYWFQYFCPPDNKVFTLSKYISRYQYYFFIPFIVYVVCFKLLVDYRHIQSTVVLYLLTKLSVGIYFTAYFALFCNIYIVCSLLESFINSVVDWYGNIFGQKIVDSFIIPKNIFGFEVLRKSIKFELASFIAYMRQTINIATNILEGIYTLFVLYHDWSPMMFWMVGPFYLIANFASSCIKISVSNKQITNTNTPEFNYFWQLFILMLYAVMIVTPIIQFHVIALNVAIFCGFSTSSIIVNLFSLVICMTFMLHKYIQKGDQVYKYLYGKNYCEDGYTLLGYEFEGEKYTSSDQIANRFAPYLVKNDNNNDSKDKRQIGLSLDEEERLMSP